MELILQKMLFSHIANTIQLELLSGITLAILIPNPFCFYQTCIVCCKYDQNWTKATFGIRQKPVDGKTECWNDEIMD